MNGKRNSSCNFERRDGRFSQGCGLEQRGSSLFCTNSCVGVVMRLVSSAKNF